MKKTALSLVILAGCTAALIMLNQRGTSARLQGRAFSLAQERFPAYLVQNTVDVYSLWQEKRVHGRIVVHLGRFFHFMEAGQSSAGAPQIASVVADHEHFALEPATYRNFLWEAFQTDIARGIYTVLPAADFSKRFDAAPTQKDIVRHEYGSPRIFTTSLPTIAEPVLLNIDASFFSSATPGQLVADLMKSGLRADVVTVCLAKDNPDVTDLDRQKAQDFATVMSAHADIVNYTPASPQAKGAK